LLNNAADVAEKLGRRDSTRISSRTRTVSKYSGDHLLQGHSFAAQRSEEFFYYAGHGVQAKGVNYLIAFAADVDL
jgi:hypothetical protein